MLVRHAFYLAAALALAAIALMSLAWPAALNALYVVVPLVALGLHDVFSKRHTVLRNYPVIGHFRYMLETIRPEIQQYFIHTDESGKPYDRETRSLVYRRAKGVDDTMPFGTRHVVYTPGYESASHSLAPRHVDPACARVEFGAERRQPYLASRLNVSAMSFGALSPNALQALNRGAKRGGFAHNTGEGGLSPHHLQGGDVIWQIGTGYFGCRDRHGNFDADTFRAKACDERVKMIEIKLSQGAKPSHGGILPAVKVSPEIAEARGVPLGEDCISPPTHAAFDGPRGLLEFVARLRELCGDKPVGFKLAIGRRSEFFAICKAMRDTGIAPDFITVDGAEGGTGAAPLEFTNNLAVPLTDALVFVNNALVGCELRDRVRVIASGKVATGFDLIVKLALGADACNCARTMMFALGCIQSLRCNTNMCPVGVATQKRSRYRMLDVDDKEHRVANYHAATIRSFLDLLRAMGVARPEELDPGVINVHDGLRVGSYRERFDFLEPGALLAAGAPDDYAREWAAARADRF
ncbi:MAG TPA: FMN-binding glutamate synthase family protein [Woeseiaceae bacterium]|nr:FMN-binding glutamate synthase family protein [Woeseiaceae bacterium]